MLLKNDSADTTYNMSKTDSFFFFHTLTQNYYFILFYFFWAGEKMKNTEIVTSNSRARITNHTFYVFHLPNTKYILLLWEHVTLDTYIMLLWEHVTMDT